MCTSCINTNLRVSLTARRLTINLERSSQIVTRIETDTQVLRSRLRLRAVRDTYVCDLRYVSEMAACNMIRPRLDRLPKSRGFPRDVYV